MQTAPLEKHKRFGAGLGLVAVLALSIPAALAQTPTGRPPAQDGTALPLGPGPNFADAMLAPKTAAEAELRKRHFLDVVRAAASSHPAVKSAATGSERSAAAIDEAFGALLPQMDFTLQGGGDQLVDPAARFRPTRNPADVDAIVTVRQLLYDFGAALDRLHSARRSAASEQANARLVAGSYVVKAVAAFYDVIRWRAKVMVAEDNVDKHQQVEKMVLARVAAHVGAYSDQARAESRQADARSTLTAYRNQLGRAEAAYVEEFGDEPNGVALPAFRPKLPNNANAAIAEGIDRSPALQKARAATAAAEASRKAVAEDNLPKIYAEVAGTRYALNEFNTDDPYGATIQFRVVYNIFSGGAAKAKERQAVLRSAQARYDEDSVVRELTRSLRFAYADLIARGKRIGTLEVSLRANRGAAEAYREQYGIGRRDLLDLLDAQREAFQAAVAVIDERLDYDVTHYSILALTGTVLDVVGISDLSGFGQKEPR